MSQINYRELINEFYNVNLAKNENNPFDPGCVAWTTREAQYTRFKVLCDIGISKDDSILDLGCGMGHFVDYLYKELTDYDLMKYTGIDINPNYIKKCESLRKGYRFICCDIFDLSESFDWVVASGVFTVLTPKKDILATLIKAHELCNKGVAVNFLTKDYLEANWISSFNPNEFHAEISEQFANTKLVTDYYNNEDFTIYIYK